MNRFIIAFAGLLFCSRMAQAYVLTFVAQFDSTQNGTNYSWFFPQNWFTTDAEGNLSPAGRVPLANETAIITGMADGGATGVRVQTLVLTNQATITNGTFSIENLKMLNESAFKRTTINLVGFMTVSGTNCVLNASRLNMLGVSTATVEPALPGGTANLILQDGAVAEVNGLFNLADAATLSGEGYPSSRISVTGILASRGNALVQGVGTNHLIIDNSRLIRANDGTLTFAAGIDWECTYGQGEFQAAIADARLVFVGGFRVAAGATSSFTGPGLSRLEGGASVHGALCVGLPPGASGAFVSGQFEVESTLTGEGQVEVLGTSAEHALLRWNAGTIGIPLLNVSAAGELQIAGSPQPSRRLVACYLNNSGRCVFTSPELLLEQGALISNLAGATFEVAGDGVIKGAEPPAGGTINNIGTFLKTSAGMTALGSSNPAEGPEFDNAGLVDIRLGELRLFGGTSSGEFHTEAGAALSFWGGTHILKKSVGFTGDGTVRLSGLAAPATWLASEGIAVPNLELGRDGAIVGGDTDTNALIYISRLTINGDGRLADGIYEVQDFELSDQPQLTNSTVNVGGTLKAAGAEFVLNHVLLRIRNTAQGTFSSGPSAAGSKLRLSEKSTLLLEGMLKLSGNSLVDSEGQVSNNFVLVPGAILSSTNSGRIQAAGTAHLVLDNRGLIRVDGGSLTFDGIIDFVNNSGTANFEAAAADSLILFAAPLYVPPSSTHVFSGEGTTRLAAGGEISGRLQVGFLDLSAAQLKSGWLEVSNNLAGTGSLDVLGDPPKGSTLAWLSGQIDRLTLNIDAGGKLLLAGDQGRRELSGCVVNNGGMCIWSGQSLTAGAGAILNVLPSGLLDIQQDGSLAYNQQAPRLTIHNSGTLVKSGGTASTLLEADVYNLARLLLKTGTLQVQGALVQSSGTTELPAGTVLAAPLFQVDDGTVCGSGKIAAKVNNAGTVAPGTSVGILTVGNETGYQQTVGGRLLVEVGGTTAGVFYDQLVVNGDVALSGKLEIQLINGFVPEQGEAFDVLACHSLSGTFSGVAGQAPAGTGWVTRYSATEATVILAGLVSIGSPVLANGQFTFQFPTTPGLLYHIQTCSDLAQPAWEEVQTISGDGTVKTASQAVGSGTRFFRLACD